MLWFTEAAWQAAYDPRIDATNFSARLLQEAKARFYALKTALS